MRLRNAHPAARAIALITTWTWAKKVHFKGLLVAQISISSTPKPASVLLTTESLLVCTAPDNLLFCAAQHPHAGLNQALQIPQHHPPQKIQEQTPNSCSRQGLQSMRWGFFIISFTIKINF